MSNQSTQQTNYFNLHTKGIGYLNDIREYQFFDMNVVGEDTKNLINRCRDAVAAKKKVLISFVMADMWYDTFTYAKDSDFHKKGDIGVSLKGRLIRINMIKVDGELKYAEQSKSADSE